MAKFDWDIVPYGRRRLGRGGFKGLVSEVFGRRANDDEEPEIEFHGIPEGVEFWGVIYRYKGKPYYHFFKKSGIGFIHGKSLIINFPFKIRYRRDEGFLD